jgi:hypothetical protein
VLICREIITDEGRTDVKHWNKLEGNSCGQTHVDVAQVATIVELNCLLAMTS